ncbi:MAG TPA: hypothetical protein VE172_00855 [Stackebrandtia sp.]|jgi:type II secretory pathway pseudopilin PulG|uniref:hypothetical protein n=1 Tax=Stackebrandtia sp. TaxID=2023065 RepID=UPI002D2D92CE|nr:hypothetical protein [Stackebrandtia sp.]HZE37339.1 hypothetical protein [Stackebrandtia sp.]
MTINGGVIAIAIVLIVLGCITLGVVSYFKTQRHRADAVAMASYRKLAEEAVSNQDKLRDELVHVRERLAAVETLLRSVE